MHDKSQSNGYYPPPAFYFKVEFTAFQGQDTSFQEVSGLNATIEYEKVAEGGGNFFYQLPKPPKYDNLILKRGMAGMSSPLVSWCSTILSPNFTKPVEPRSLNVFLLNEQGEPCRAWNVVNALPVKWQIDAFNSTKNDVAIETIELTYHYFTREDGNYGH
ncbi:phage tail protein [Desulfobacula phenolica]|uniref:Conserved hypothetical phage tail region protein n=1 Tax=Desulfobacula phenolica TaxID=90732 RepID=A0A1H2JP19_9BACT|nr:phage tail protein [Desulfobacula phenolica]SDU58259.1 conserved hypothetical phage tail region protein [Desulfobacula phenolica]